MSQPADNTVQTFQLESSNLRGRIVRLGSVLEEILSPHNYDDEVAHLTGEAATLAVLLASMLKYEGIFTLQAQGDGCVKTLVADITSAGEVRACASYDPERLPEFLAGAESSQDRDLVRLLGKGYFAFTVDQGRHTERYQGLVELKGATLTDCVHHYFHQSEQIGTGIKLAVGKRDGKWRAGAIMLQHLPEQSHDFEAGISNAGEDDWRRAMTLLGSCTDNELLSDALSGQALLFRLFHEEGVRVFEPEVIKKGCRCTDERLLGVLMTLPPEDRQEMAVDGKIQMSCEFCCKDFVFDPKEIDRMIEEKTNEA